MLIVIIKSNPEHENFKFIFNTNLTSHVSSGHYIEICPYIRKAYFKGSPDVYQAVFPNVYPNHIFHLIILCKSNMNNG